MNPHLEVHFPDSTGWNLEKQLLEAKPAHPVLILCVLTKTFQIKMMAIFQVPMSRWDTT
jgi:hypothetical protein